MLAQGDLDQDRSPGGMLTSQGQSGLTEFVGIGVRESLGRAIVRGKRVAAAEAKSSQEMAHGAWGEAEGGGEAARGFALLGTSQ